jgi:hypothetical protein
MSMLRAIVVPGHYAQAVLPAAGRRLGMLLDREAAVGLSTEATALRLVYDGNCDHRAARMVGLPTLPGDALVRIGADLRADVDHSLRLS